MKCTLRVPSFLVGLVFLVVPLDQGLANRCLDLATTWRLETVRFLREAMPGQGEERVLVGSTGLLRNLNNNVFASWSRGSEYLTNVSHFLFQYHLYREIDRTSGFQLLRVKSPYVKNIEVYFRQSVPNGVVVRLAEAANRAAMRDLTSFIFDDDPAVASLVASIEGSTSPLALTHLYVFAENQHFLKPLTPAEGERLRQDLRRFYGTSGRFRADVERTYGVGLADSIWDAHFAAKLSSAQGRGYGPVVAFDPQLFRRVIRGIQNQRQQLDAVFAGKSDEELLDIFRAARAGLPGHPDLPRFMRTLNFLDYLPEEWLATDGREQTKFDRLVQPTGVVLLDIKAVGARNFLSLFKNVDVIDRHLQIIDGLVTQLNAAASRGHADSVASLEEQLAAEFNDIIAIRTQVFRESNDVIQSVRNEIIGTLRAQNLPEAQFAVWVSGDDIVIGFKDTVNAGGDILTARRLSQLLQGIEVIQQNSRMSYIDTRDFSEFYFHDARLTVGTTLSLLKAVEALNLGYSVVAEFVRGGGPPQVRLFRVEGGRLSETPEEHRPAVQSMAPGWNILW